MISPSDHLAIIGLYRRYNETIDAGDSGGWIDAFTADGVFEHPAQIYAGQIELGRFIRERSEKLKMHACIHQRHWNAELELTRDGTRIRGACQLLVSGVERETEQTMVLATGRYNDLLIHDAGVWRFQRRRLELNPL